MSGLALEGKFCPRCEETKPTGEFRLRGADSERPVAYCRPCERAYKREYRAANPDKVRAERERVDPEKARAAARRHYLANRERILLAGKRREQEKRAERRETHRLWRQRNPETVREINRRKRREYPEKARAHDAVKRALKSRRLVRPDACEMCSTEGALHAHHADYAKQLDVQWLCPLCHARLHLSQEEVAA